MENSCDGYSKKGYKVKSVKNEKGNYWLYVYRNEDDLISPADGIECKDKDEVVKVADNIIENDIKKNDILEIEGKSSFEAILSIKTGEKLEIKYENKNIKTGLDINFLIDNIIKLLSDFKKKGK